MKHKYFLEDKIMIDLETLKKQCEEAKARAKAQFGFECGYKTIYTLGCGECIYGREMNRLIKSNTSKERKIGEKNV